MLRCSVHPSRITVTLRDPWHRRTASARSAVAGTSISCGTAERIDHTRRPRYQRRIVDDLVPVDHHVRLRIRENREFALAHKASDLRPRAAVPVEERDPPVAQVVQRVFRLGLLEPGARLPTLLSAC